MKKLIYLVLFLYFVSPTLEAQSSFSLERSTPEAEGISSKAILDFIDAAEKEIDALHSFMVVKNGKVVSEAWWNPYNSASPHELWSLSKSFTSTAIGFATQENLLSINDLVISFFPNKVPEKTTWQLEQLRVKDLLTMTTGHNKEPFNYDRDDDWVKVFLNSNIPYLPGTHFMYNTPATYMLSAIIQKVTGDKLVDYLFPRLFEPLGIELPQWEMDPLEINTGGWGLHLKTEDIAKFGQFYLQKGNWNGEQLLSESWIEMASSKQVSNGSNPENDWMQGYGFQFWRSRHNTYRGDGAMGQFCLVFPQNQTVIAITSGTNNMGQIMQLTWNILLPALEKKTLPTDIKAHQDLKNKTASLALKPVVGKKSSSLQKKWLKKKRYFPQNGQGIKSIEFQMKKGGNTLYIEMENGTETIPFGYGKYVKSEIKNHLPHTNSRRSSYIPSSSLRYHKNKKVASSGAWINEKEFQLRIYLYHTPARMNYNFKFSDLGVTLKCTAENYLGKDSKAETLKSL